MYENMMSGNAWKPMSCQCLDHEVSSMFIITETNHCTRWPMAFDIGTITPSNQVLSTTKGMKFSTPKCMIEALQVWSPWISARMFHYGFQTVGHPKGGK